MNPHSHKYITVVYPGRTSIKNKMKTNSVTWLINQCKTVFSSRSENRTDIEPRKNGENHIKKSFSWLINRNFFSRSKPKGYENRAKTGSLPQVKTVYIDEPKILYSVPLETQSTASERGERSQDHPPSERQNESVWGDGESFPTAYFDYRNISSPTHYDFDDFFATFPSLNFFNFDEQNWANGTRFGPGDTIPPTLQASQNENNTGHTNYNVVEQNNTTMRHTANNGCAISYAERYNTSPDTAPISSNTTYNAHPDTIRISSNTSPAGVDNPRTYKKTNISLEVLQQHFKMRLDDAADSLKVSRSTLKRICREKGIERWPGKGKKINDERIKSEEKKVNKLIQIDNKDQTNQSNMSRAVIVNPLGEASCSSRNVTIRATYGDDTIKFPFSISCGLNDLKKKTCKRLGVNISIKLKYKDEDGDLVLIACDDALHEILGKNTTFDFSVFRDTNEKV